MYQLVNHLARRGYEAHQRGELLPNGAEELDIPIWAIVYFVSTGLIFTGVMFTMNYFYGEVIATLCMVESPTATLYVPVPNNDDPDAPLEKKVPELALKKEAPITSSLFKAKKHLFARAGSLSRFRGISIALFKNFVIERVARLFIYVLPLSYASLAISIILSEVALAHISLGWTHIIITESSSKYWFQRVPSFRLWRKVAGPTLILAVAEQAAMLVPTYLGSTWGMGNQFNGAQVLILLFLGLATTFLVVIPARVTLTRVQASLLPEDQETIVPFDRSFDGKVIPEIVGGSGMIGVLDAWKTFDFSSRIRLIKLYATALAMQFCVVVLYVTVTAVVLFFAAGPAFTNAIARAHDNAEYIPRDSAQ